MPLQFREIRSTHRIHIFEVPDGGGEKLPRKNRSAVQRWVP